MKYSVIDFHTHPFTDLNYNICQHQTYCNRSIENTKKDLLSIGVEKICGSVIHKNRLREQTTFLDVKEVNDKALFLRDVYDGFYVPGFHIHPKFVKESISEVERMHASGVNLVGELVPYVYGWTDWASNELFEILEAVDHYGMVLNFHGLVSEEQEDQLDVLVKRFKNMTIVGAHPGDVPTFTRHLNRMDMNKNYHVDLSGGGIARHGLLRHGIDEFGAERFIFGSDYPICNPAMYVGGVALDFLLSEEEKKLILKGNAERILKLK